MGILAGNCSLRSGCCFNETMRVPRALRMSKIEENKLRAMVLSAAMMALGLTLPILFHTFGLGSKFLPMLLPLLLNGFLSPWLWALLTGAVTPWVSMLMTGMPPLYPPIVLIVSCEGAVLGSLAALTYRISRPRIGPALLVAILGGRGVAFLLTWVLARYFGLPPGLASVASLLQSLPGVLLQLTVAPLVVRMLSNRKGLLFRHEHGREA